MRGDEWQAGEAGEITADFMVFSKLAVAHDVVPMGWVTLILTLTLTPTLTLALALTLTLPLTRTGPPSCAWPRLALTLALTITLTIT